MNRSPLLPDAEPITFTGLAPRILPAGCWRKIASLKEALLTVLLAEYAESVPPQLLAQALNEAEALASLTPHPALFLPALAQEKVAAASAWAERQRQLRSQEIALAV
jgi:hypothetical protein